MIIDIRKFVDDLASDVLGRPVKLPDTADVMKLRRIFAEGFAESEDARGEERHRTRRLRAGSTRLQLPAMIRR